LADLDIRSDPVDQPPAPPPPEEGDGKAPAKRSPWRWLFIIGAIFVAVVVYAYAFEKTDVDLDEIQSETRQTQLVRILRSLARPEIFTYETVDTNIDTQFLSPCPEGGYTPPAPDTSGPYVVLNPSCVEPGGELEILGFNFPTNTRGDIYYATETIEINLGDFRTDTAGEFVEVISTRERPSEEPQTIRVVTELSVGSVWTMPCAWLPFCSHTTVDTGEADADTGEAITTSSPRFSETTKDTWDKIIETVFLALIATTVGTVIAVPLSFMASRNLMKEISVTMTALTLSILGGIIGIGVGLWLARLTRSAAENLAENNLFLGGALLLLLGAMYFATKWAIPGDEEDLPSRALRTARIAVMLAVGIGAILALFLTAAAMTSFGNWLAPKIGGFEFLALFISSIGDILKLLIVAVAILFTGGLFMFFGGRLGTALRAHLPNSLVKPLNLLLATLAGAIASLLLAQFVAWLYEFNDPATTIWLPLLVGAALGFFGALIMYRRSSVGIGLSTYYAARTVFNGIRAIEPLVMVIVFVVWVGIGPFAGALALALHTTAALAKLYSEQVESINLGPLEAVKATGATRLQTIVYAVAPQIVPPYISFTMYRWDINVRMSTIIGFAGGGGIGFLLQQNINLLNYRAAAVQMLAIAIVVATMDYISSRLRERFV
jgi:phosphonate ABC transporter permease subunit PhnE